MIKTVRDVLQYLLAHDSDPWPEIDMVGGKENPFLCHRIEAMDKRELLDVSLRDAAIQWIEKRIKGIGTLSGYHCHHMEREPVSVTSDEWPPIRRGYLEQWIRELENER